MEAYIKSKTKNASQIDFSDGFTPTTSYRTLALDTLSEKDDFRLKERDRRPIPYPWGSLTTEGINKAQSAPLYRYTKRGSAAQKTLAKTFDDAEMRPKKLTSANAFADAVNRIVLDARKKKMGPRGTNPLDPTYKLPTFVKETPPVPRFIKDNLDTSDIKGTSPHPVQKAFMRNTLQVDDIEGTKVGWRPKYRENFGRNVRDLNLDVRDINKMRKKKIKAEKEPIDVGVKRQTKRPQSVTYSLKTNDIDGAQSRPRGRYLPCGQKRTQYVHTNNTQDIRGATPKKRSDRRPYSAPIDRTGLSSRASNLIESKIRESIQRQYHDISNSFRNLDRDGSGKLTTEEFSRVMSKCEIRMAEDEAKLVVQGFDTNNSGTVDYAKVLKAIGPSYVSQNLGRSSAAEVAEPAAPAETLGGGDENAVVDAEVQTAAQPAGPSPEEEGAAGAEKSAPTPAPAQASKPATLSQRIEEARRGSQEEEWKPSKFAVVKADRPHTVSASSRPQRAKAQRQKAAQRPMTSPGGGRRRKVSIQSKPATLERPRSAFTNVKCRTQTWERSQLREDIATIRALR
ncbi:EF-hand domain-containing protein [Chloropicon roscoffensis]|uniref:EF-hand domain-containing protein n=3 Tax=Chloropicon roscoffensis TaxID=1461544 RepID=A0AAX4PL48_9CHLO